MHQQTKIQACKYPKLTQEKPKDKQPVISVISKTARRNTNNFRYASLVAQLVKTPPTMQETPVRFLGQEDPLEKG